MLMRTPPCPPPQLWKSSEVKQSLHKLSGEIQSSIYLACLHSLCLRSGLDLRTGLVWSCICWIFLLCSGSCAGSPLSECEIAALAEWPRSLIMCSDSLWCGGLAVTLVATDFCQGWRLIINCRDDRQPELLHQTTQTDRSTDTSTDTVWNDHLLRLEITKLLWTR